MTYTIRYLLMWFYIATLLVASGTSVVFDALPLFADVKINSVGSSIAQILDTLYLVLFQINRYVYTMNEK